MTRIRPHSGRWVRTSPVPRTLPLRGISAIGIEPDMLELILFQLPKT